MSTGLGFLKNSEKSEILPLILGFFETSGIYVNMGYYF